MGIKDRILKIREKINSTCIKASRNLSDITLIAVSKKQTSENIIEAVNSGITNIGESYVQEFIEKKEKITDKNILWHFIGQLQSNKVKYLKDQVVCIHSVYKESVLIEIQKRMPDINFFLEINIGNEDNKGGIKLSEINPFFENMLNKFKIRPTGFMCIPPFDESAEKSRKYFSQLRELLFKINKEYNLNMKYLSMGMSNDFDIAIEEGATHLRIGTSIFGERN